MGEMNTLSGMLYCADCGKRMYLCRCTTMKQAEYFNCSSYRKALKRTCTSHQITVKAVETLLLEDLRRTVRFAKSQKQTFLQLLQNNADEKKKLELKANTHELTAAEERIKALDKIIVHEKRKENGHYRQEVEIVYNFIGAVEFPDFVNVDDDYGLDE